MAAWSCWDGVGKLVGSPQKDSEHERRGLGSHLKTSCSSSYVPGPVLRLGGDLGKLNEMLPDYAGCGMQLRDFWATFASIELQPLLEMKRSNNADKELNMTKKRCLEATYPFNLVIEMLDSKWKPRLSAQPGSSEGSSKSREAVIADRNAEHWDMLLIVQRLLGRSFPAPAWDKQWKQLEQAIQERRDVYLQQARAFQFIAAVLTNTWDTCAQKMDRHCDQQQLYVDKVTALIVAQRALPLEWRQRLDSSGRPSNSNGEIDSCWSRGK